MKREQQGVTTMTFKTIKHLAVSALLLAGAAAFTAASVPTHAAPAAGRSARCMFPCVPPAPTLSTFGEYGTVYISGAHWTPNTVVTIDIYMPVNAGGEFTETDAWVNAQGNFSTSWLAPHGCFYGKVEVQAYYYSNPASVLTQYPVPECIG
jgi:hypothetical protein